MCELIQAASDVVQSGRSEQDKESQSRASFSGLPVVPRLLSRHHLLLLPRCMLVLLLYKVVLFMALFGCCKDFVLFSHFFVIPRKHGIAVQISKHTHTSENGIAV